MNKEQKRTRPLDRDGDGRDGGSLPGNQTAPMSGADADDPNRSEDGPPNSDAAPPPEAPPADDQTDAAEGQDTFTPEEIAAGQTPVVEQEGDSTTTAADQSTVIDDADPLVTIATETAPIAARLRELEVLAGARYLYHSPQGYSSNYGAPFIDEATVQVWLQAGLAEHIPSAGNTGGVRATDEGRRQVQQLRREQAEAA